MDITYFNHYYITKYSIKFKEFRPIVLSSLPIAPSKNFLVIHYVLFDVASLIFPPYHSQLFRVCQDNFHHRTLKQNLFLKNYVWCTFLKWSSVTQKSWYMLSDISEPDPGFEYFLNTPCIDWDAVQYHEFWKSSSLGLDKAIVTR